MRLAKPRPLLARSAILWLLVAPLLWAVSIVVGRMLRNDIAPIALTFWRWAIALCIPLPLSYRKLIAHRHTLRREWKIIIASGVVGTALYQLVMYQALTLSLLKRSPHDVLTVALLTGGRSLYLLSGYR